jgi:CheY-like chemotaxis protein
MMLSSSGQHGDSARCKEVGVANYLIKPVDQRELLGAIGRALSRDQSPRLALPDAMLATDLPARRLHLLVADDNSVNQRLTTSLLERRGHRVTVVSNGKEALAALDRQPFDAVLMDVQMPEMGGFEATAAIRTRERGTGAHLPIIAMTAHAMKGDRERCVEAGMDEYVTKPLDSRRLCQVVEHIGIPFDPDEEPQTPAADVYSTILTRVGGDTGLLAEISRLFIADLPGYLVRIRTAIDAGDGDALRRAAHAFKGAAANFEAAAVVQAARQLEELGRTNDPSGRDEVWQLLNAETSALVATLRHYIAREPLGI